MRHLRIVKSRRKPCLLGVLDPLPLSPLSRIFSLKALRNLAISDPTIGDAPPLKPRKENTHRPFMPWAALKTESWGSIYNDDLQEKLCRFLKHVLDIETLPSHEAVVRKAFDAFILERNYNADRSRSLRAVQTVFLDRKKVEIGDLYEEPFTSFGMNALERLFSDKEIEEPGRFVRRLAA